MLDLISLGTLVAARRRRLKLSQLELAKKASISRATLDALENGRIGELGFNKIAKILSVLGMQLKAQDIASTRPTLDELIEEQRDDKGLDRRS